MSATALPRLRGSRHPRAAWIVAGGAVVVLLGCFAAVLYQAVQQGDRGRRAAAMQAEAEWRCRALRPDAQRERCLARVQSQMPVDSEALQGLVSDVGAASSARVRP